MDATASNINDNHKIVLAASWRCESESDIGDIAYKAFTNVMEYRRKIAIQYLNEQNEENKKNIKLILEHCNDEIRKILGL